EDRLIINKQGTATPSLLQILISNQHYQTFKTYIDDKQLLHITLLITRPPNHPALFDPTVKNLPNFKKSISVVFQSHIYTLPQLYPQTFLHQFL
ncbi:YwpF-like family protein, partial [Staphylococcus capitis]|uniref:YwpF-like family protein n=1 Tax=Staphylococcus capitis TaxID=29388 RepID=UPI001C92D160